MGQSGEKGNFGEFAPTRSLSRILSVSVSTFYVYSSRQNCATHIRTVDIAIQTVLGNQNQML